MPGPLYRLRVIELRGYHLSDQPDAAEAYKDQSVWIQNSDVDGHDGGGTMTVTTDPTLALTFESFAAAHAYWIRPSEVAPTRPDGQVNRPLTAYTVEIEPVPDPAVEEAEVTEEALSTNPPDPDDDPWEGVPVLDVNAADPVAEAARYAAAVEEWVGERRG